MSDRFVAEIRPFAFNFAPTGWAEANGQLMPISQNTALFSLLGTTYGGDGKSTFALPDLRGAVPIHPDQGPGLSQRFLGEMGGTQNVTLLQSEMPVHNHQIYAQTVDADLRQPGPSLVLAKSDPGPAYAPASPGQLAQMAFETLAPAGGSLPHNNLMPYLTITFCIALQGIFPQRP